ncbi:MAG: Fic family protein [Bacteroidales bacterium]|nr:Fic family protein [Bacteroidales bacterium]
MVFIYSYIQFENRDIHPLIFVTNLDYEFLSIHPFQDGNISD